MIIVAGVIVYSREYGDKLCEIISSKTIDDVSGLITFYLNGGGGAVRNIIFLLFNGGQGKGNSLLETQTAFCCSWLSIPLRERAGSRYGVVWRTPLFFHDDYKTIFVFPGMYRRRRRLSPTHSSAGRQWKATRIERGRPPTIGIKETETVTIELTHDQSILRLALHFLHHGFIEGEFLLSFSFLFDDQCAQWPSMDTLKF